MDTDLANEQQRHYLYRQIADKLHAQISVGLYAIGSKIPGVRKLAIEYGVSINTVLQAQKILENQGLIYAVPRSGYFVSSTPVTCCNALQQAVISPLQAKLVARQRLALDLIQATARGDIAQLGAALPHASFYPTAELQRLAGRIAKSKQASLATYAVPPGSQHLCAALAQKMRAVNCEVAADDILISNGCHEALLIALKCVTQAGDVVLLESPTYYGLLQLIDTLALRAVEIPCHPETGMALDKVASACEQWQVKACVVVGNFSNPLGCCPLPQQKQALLALLKRYDVALIEDDIYGDLCFAGQRPLPYKHFDTAGQVLYCSSFSKSLAAGLRIGWLVAGKYRDKAAYIKFTQNIASSALNQHILYTYLQNGSLDRHVRKLRLAYSSNIAECIEFIQRNFPSGTLCSHPRGGFVLWVQLPAEFDSAKLYQQALQHNISIAPGFLFASDARFKNYFRLNCALPWQTILLPALAILASILQAK